MLQYQMVLSVNYFLIYNLIDRVWWSHNIDIKIIKIDMKNLQKYFWKDDNHKLINFSSEKL